MDQHLYQCVELLAGLGTPEQATIEKVSVVLAEVKERLAGVAGDEGGRVLATVTHLLATVDVCVRDDVRLECGCVVVSLLHHISELLLTLEEALTPTPPTRGPVGDAPHAPPPPPPPPHLISLQQTQVLAAACRLALYTVVLAGLDQEAARYVKMSLARSKFVLGPALLEVPQGSRHSLLAATMRLLVPVVKQDTLGAGIRQAAFPEVLSALLCLCFCPPTPQLHPQDTAFFRTQLEAFTAAVDTSVTLRHLLLLMGLAQGGSNSGSSSSNSSSSSVGGSSGGSGSSRSSSDGGGAGGGGGGRGWLGRTCNSLLVRRYLMAKGGVVRVVGAGLTLCDGQDVRKCQAVAALVAHARTQDVGLFYSALGPQVVALLNTPSQLAPEMVRVMVLLAGELAERSPTLAAHHLGRPLLQPLTLTTQPDTLQEGSVASLTECVASLHTLMVETAPPTQALARLLQPALGPLLAIAALPLTHLRSPARHLVSVYLSHVSKGEIVSSLVSLAGLVPVTTSPPVHPDLALVLDEAGGVKVEARPGPVNALEEDEARASCLSAILEDLGQPGVVLAFYKKLVEFLDFREVVKDGQGSGPAVVSLRTEADEVAGQFERARQVAMCVGLLSCLAESEKLTGDLFQDLSAAGPVVDGLLRAGCQECRDEGLRAIQVSLTANVLVLVTCYVSDRSLRGEMTSGDWAGLKALLPALELTEECLEDEGVRLMATQLRHMLATHGVARTDGNTSSQTQGKVKKGRRQQNTDIEDKTQIGKEKSKVEVQEDTTKDTERRTSTQTQDRIKYDQSEAVKVHHEEGSVTSSNHKDSATPHQRNSAKVKVQDSGMEVKEELQREGESVVKSEPKERLNDRVEKLKEEEKEEEEEEEVEKRRDGSEVVKVKEEEVEKQEDVNNSNRKEEEEREKQEHTNNNNNNKTRSKRENEIQKNKTDETETKPKNTNQDKKNTEKQHKQTTESDLFQTAMNDLMSPLLPIRGHGLLALARLVEERHKMALEHGTQLLALFQHHMREEDSYLYLMAVKGLAALCDVLPDKAVCVLTREFSVGRRTPEDRTKLAESLSRAARRLGPLLPHYREHFINAFLSGVRDEEWLVRAASLSALGDVCKELRFSLGPIVHEVFSVLYSAVAQDSSVEVRRAAVMVVTMLLQGLGGDALKVLRNVLRDLYRVLRHLESSDPDPVVRLHSQLALQEVDAIMRRFLLPSLGLTKRIYVMDAPPPAL